MSVASGTSMAVIRHPRREDAERIAEVHVATWKETYAELLPDGFFTEDHTRMRRAMWARILSEPRPGWSIRVAESDGEIIGLALAGPSRGAGEKDEAGGDAGAEPLREIHALYVLRAHHGAGVGQALLDAVVGSGPLILWVARQNPRAAAFYRRNGFRVDGAAESDPAAPGVVDVRMVRGRVLRGGARNVPEKSSLTCASRSSRRRRSGLHGPSLCGAARTLRALGSSGRGQC